MGRTTLKIYSDYSYTDISGNYYGGIQFGKSIYGGKVYDWNWGLSGSVKRWNGSSWEHVEGDLKYYNGTSWV